MVVGFYEEKRHLLRNGFLIPLLKEFDLQILGLLVVVAIVYFL